MTELHLQVGLNAITQYRRLDYTPWHAIAEFVDNSTQSYLNSRDALQEAFDKDEEGFEVHISYDRDHPARLRVADNAMGMSLPELEHALHIARPPNNTDGRSRYGLGMKTAACWVGNVWTITTKKLGSSDEYTVHVDVEQIAKGDSALHVDTRSGLPSHQHYTIIEVIDHNKEFKGRTLGKIKDHLRSMYRKDIESGKLKISWRGEELEWEGLDEHLLRNIAGDLHKKDFKFEVDGHTIHGWAGVLERGKRSDAGFSMLQANRVIRGWPSAWRPERIYGAERNDLINQRLIGEIHLDGFEVTHTKDNIQWHGDQEERVEKILAQEIDSLVKIARSFRKKDDSSSGPSDADIDSAAAALAEELNSPEIVDSISIDDIPEDDIIGEGFSNVADDVESKGTPRISAKIGSFMVHVYLSGDMSPNDPYFIVDSARPDEVIIIINLSHPYLQQLDGPVAVRNYFKDCIYDGLAAHQSQNKRGRIEWNTVSLLKDRLLRVSFEMMEAEAETEE
ncbi:ATP-binding protein [Aureimonas ureilytica]|uniref:ATP-binding protein n=1 Tax=Aureimonas ureilytica TaxID=401562 RepID=UPI000B1287AF|nr:ATP-binding protein [Aureimonas ureilytica]